MAYDTLIDKSKEIAQRKSLADHIRAKGGTTAPLTWGKGYEDAVDAITGAPKDPHTLLLLHCDSLTDSSKYNVPLSNNGVTISTTQSKFGGKSLYFDGNAWINFPQEYAPYKDKDFTIDWWEYCTTSDVNHQSRYFSSDAGGPSDTLGLLLGHLGKQAYCGNGWSMVNGAEMFNIVQNQWVHWATVRHGNVLLTFRNGKKFAQTSIVGSIPYDTKTMHCIGGWRYSPGQKWIGYMDEFRISDIARWTTDFTPPNAPYDNTQACKPEQEKTVNAIKNGPVVVTPDVGKVLSKATVNVNVPSDKKPEQTKTVDITSNGDVTITPDAGKVLSSVLAKVNVSGGGGLTIKYVTFTPATDEETHKVLCPFTDYRNQVKIQILMPNIIAPEPREYVPINTCGVFIGRRMGDVSDGEKGSLISCTNTTSRNSGILRSGDYIHWYSSPFAWRIENGYMALGEGMNNTYFKFRAGIEYIWIGVGET